MVAMKEHGLGFKAPMVRALLAGSKTMTRRLVKFPDGAEYDGHRPDGSEVRCSRPNESTGERVIRAPHGPVGRRLWCRETWHQCPHCERTVSYLAGGWREAPSGAPDDAGDGCDNDTRPLSPKCEAHGWKPSIHMPRWASRITLEVTRVRVERVGDLSEEDARAEGVDWAAPYYTAAELRRRLDEDDREDPREVGYPSGSFARQNYADLWDEINGAGSFAASPWVWVYDFRRVE